MRPNSQSKLFISGNEAIALGAYEAGVSVAASYPGTPATEILENLMRQRGVYAEWAPNEKVAVEVALGASFAGARSLASMKNVGLNNAADPLFTSAYTGVRGGLVIVTADDPGVHSSQNEQDSRNYALAAKLPMLEPSDPAEAREFTKLAFELSERFDVPVLLRTTTRVSHVKGIVRRGWRRNQNPGVGLQKDPEKLVMLPEYAIKRRADLEKRLSLIRAFAENFKYNRIEDGDGRTGFITSGVSYLYVKEAFPHAPVLKLGMVHPLPAKLIRSFAEKVENLYVIEELDPFIELQVEAMGIRCTGKGVVPRQGEIDQTVLRRAVLGDSGIAHPAPELPSRNPVMCPGCSYRGVFYALKKLKVFVAGDIGCYTLSALKPLETMDSVLCMGASIGMAHGMDKALSRKNGQKAVAVIGDSTFIHSGINGLIDVAYNRGSTTVVILDNGVTAMTGLQPTPASGIRASGEPAPSLDFRALAEAVGIRSVHEIDPYDIRTAVEIIRREIDRPEPSVIVARGPCMLLPEMRRRNNPAYGIIAADCDGCRKCIGLGCPAVVWKNGAGRGRAEIIAELCSGCGLCNQVCESGAVSGL